MKPYKRRSPIETITEIRRILDSCGLLLKETHFIAPDLFSCRVNLANEGLDSLDIGTNGKGRSVEYSLASAYAEFMERLQNHCLLDDHKMLTSKTFGGFSFVPDYEESQDYHYDKNETTISPDHLDITVQSDLKIMCGVPQETDISEVIVDKEVLTIPFYDCFGNREVMLPIDFILESTGSNGMAAGNTPKEAILQGICELWERYVVKALYLKKVVPPIVPLDTFRGTAVYDKIERYKKKTKLDIQIRDCSLDEGIPALALLIVDREHQRYNLKVGVDFVPEVALERCFTETHQGRIRFKGLPFSFTDYLGQEYDSVAGEEDSMIKTFINSSGYWPLSILYSTPSYEFRGFDGRLGKSNAEDLSYALSYFQSKGYNVYIRDNSYLGFPAYFIYVPQISSIVRKSSNKASDSLYSYSSSFMNLRAVNQLGRINPEMAEAILTGINDNYEKLHHNEFSISRAFVYHINKDLRELSLEMLAALLAFYLGDVETCVKYLKLYLKGKNKSEYRYYYGCVDYLELSRKVGAQEARRILSLLYGEDLASEIIDDLSCPREVFQYYHLPNCPYCDNCKLADECKEKNIQKISDKIHEISDANYIKQMKVRDYLTNTEE